MLKQAVCELALVSRRAALPGPHAGAMSGLIKGRMPAPGLLARVGIRALVYHMFVLPGAH
jgi:hypothetical protein